MAENKIYRGLGDSDFNIGVFIQNEPDSAEFSSLTSIQALQSGDITRISSAFGNGWRKVFNVYAKLLFALDSQLFPYQSLASSWQQYRDQYLLQQGSKTALIFGSPHQIQTNAINIITGRHFGAKSESEFEFVWVDHHFALCPPHRVIICPYFDYRQLTNARIEQLSVYINQFVQNK
ncbi:DUF6942 family protein [Neptunicella marina]|uniref:Uncharacterized protein n=1 Tax=Neptunicella marina TaxID=2125989 RepID=A0A8J6LV22_9ALTE|nr:hypothetical protein [Neptunicella marina]MBC3764274.1 hypothetical protein [Neptunicella marina]